MCCSKFVRYKKFKTLLLRMVEDINNDNYMIFKALLNT